MKNRLIEQLKQWGLKVQIYPNGEWEYKDKDGYFHLFKNDEELLPEIEKLCTYSYANGDWEYVDTNGYRHLIRDGKEVSPEIKKRFILLYPNGDWEYMDTNGKWHIVKGDNNGN